MKLNDRLIIVKDIVRSYIPPIVTVTRDGGYTSPKTKGKRNKENKGGINQTKFIKIHLRVYSF